MRILVTGGAGFIGSHLVESLLAEGHEVTVLDNFSRGRISDAGKRFRLVQGDIRDRETVTKAMTGVDTLFHLAEPSNVVGDVTDLDYSFTTNVCGTFKVLRAAQEAGVRRVIFTSSREVYGDAAVLPVSENAPLPSKNAYGANKVAGELYCRVFGAAEMGLSVLHLANVYGPGDRDRVIPIFLDNAAQGRPLRINGDQQVIHFVWVGTVVTALRAVAFGPLSPVPVNIGSGEGTTLMELAETILALTGTKVDIEMASARSFETVTFVADVRQAERLLGIGCQEHPLFGLSTMLPAVVA